MCAGFGAWEHAYRRKYGGAPALFAYAARGPLGAVEVGPFPLPAGACAVLLDAEEKLDPLFADHPAACSAIRAGGTVGAIQAAVGDEDAANRLLVGAMHRRLLTLHHVREDA